MKNAVTNSSYRRNDSSPRSGLDQATLRLALIALDTPPNRLKDLTDTTAIVLTETLGVLATKVYLTTKKNCLALISQQGLPEPIHKELLAEQVHVTGRHAFDTLEGYTMLRGHAVTVANLPNETRFNPPAYLINNGITSALSTPIAAAESTAEGVLTVLSENSRTFTVEETNFLKDISTILSQAHRRIEEAAQNSKRVAAIQSSFNTLQQEKDFIYDALDTLSYASSPSELAQNAANLVTRSLSDFCFVDLICQDSLSDYSRTIQARRLGLSAPENYPDAEDLEKMKETYPLNLRSRRGTPRVLRTGRSQHFAHISDSLLREICSSKSLLNTYRNMNAKSYLGVPILSRGQVIGAIVLIFSDDSLRNTDFGHLVNLVEGLADCLSLSLTNLEKDLLEVETRGHNGHGNSIISDNSHNGYANNDEIPIIPHKEYGTLPKYRDYTLNNDHLQQAASQHHNLTRGQITVLEEIAHDKTIADIAKSLHLSENTIKTHLYRARQTLGIPDRKHLVVYAQNFLKSPL